MRWQPQVDDEANKGLHILKDLMLPVKQNHPEISLADLWAFAGCCGIEFLGGPKIPFKFGRRDDQKPYRVPPNGRLPDASQGAEHLRAIFGGVPSRALLASPFLLCALVFSETDDSRRQVPETAL